MLYNSSEQIGINSVDVKTAYAICKTPKEVKTDKIWKLSKCVYGLAGASRYWYLKLRKELIKPGAIPIQLDQGIFIWQHNNKPIGIMTSFVRRKYQI